MFVYIEDMGEHGILKWMLVFVCIQATVQYDPVVFTLGQNSHFDATDATTIPFSKVITDHNTNGGLSSGVFTCQQDGLYKFQVYTLTRSDTRLYLELFLNSNIVASLWGHTPSDYAAAGNAAILELQHGDTVQVKTRSNYTVNVYGTDQEIYTTFSGVQLGSLEDIETGYSLSVFSATLNQHQIVTGGTSVLYNKVLVDTNGAYNVTTGIFTAPSGGVYIFHIFSLARANQELYQNLYHNGDYVCSLYGLTDNDWADAGNTVILHLQAGDTVTMKARAGRDNNLYGDLDQIYSTFTGAELVTDTAISQGDTDEPILAFSAGLSKGYTVSNGDKVIFDRTFIDLKHTYNHLNGEFVAPVSGIYEFNFHALGEKENKIYLQLYHNYRYVDSLYSHTPGHWATAGNSAILYLDSGDIMFVQAHGDNALYGTSDQIYCTFSGYLLHSTDSAVVVGK